MARTLPVIAETAATLLPVTPHFWNELDEVRQTGTWDNHDGVNLVGAAIDFETFLENPAEWAGQFAPEVLISIATGGGGAITRVASTATRATSAARPCIAHYLLRVKPRLALRCGQISGSGLRVSRVDLCLCLTLGEV